MKKLTTEPVLAVVTLVLVAAVLLTRSVDMSNNAQMMLLGIFVAAVFGYATLIYKESPADEREQNISMLASKYAYITGAAVLSLGIVIQSLDHTLDVWLPVALGSMVLSKSFGFFIHNR